MKEIFVYDKETGLHVSNLGNIIGLRGKPRKFKIDRYGYLICGCYIQATQKMKWIPVHRLVARNFVPNPNEKPCINHKDENKRNNESSNLEWCTIRENNTYGTRMERVRHSLGTGGVEKMLINHKLNGGKKSERQITIQFKDTNDIRTFRSISEASRQLNIIRSSLNRLAIGKLKSANGWHLASEKYSPVAKRIVFERDGVIREFESQTEAMKEIGCSDYFIAKFKKGGCGQINGWHYVEKTI